jgi:hypothetical protein
MSEFHLGLTEANYFDTILNIPNKDVVDTVFFSPFQHISFAIQLVLNFA